MKIEWILGIQIGGEWEHCRFPDRTQALAAFKDINSDYTGKIERAVLVRAAASPVRTSPVSSLVH